ncbi:primosomal protein N' [Maioricimonas sp. JC845]|uniref:replication restart helicase PriA n=1 Tax=Maioricimonas sp. JC845 TaxID=3232138 RepID=UPI003457AC75
MNQPRQQQLFEPPPEPTPWERAAESDQLIAEVVLNRPLTEVYHYLVPDPLRPLLAPGQRVKVPFGRGNKLLTGYCVGFGKPGATNRRLKSIEAVVDRMPLVSAEMLELTRWMGERYLCSWGQVLESVIPAGVKKQAGTREILHFIPAEGVCERIGELKLPRKQRAILEELCRSDEPMTADELTAAASCGTAPLQGLRDKQLVQPIRRRQETFQVERTPVERQADLTLNAEQQQVLNEIHGLLRNGQHETILLHGVTGSGKTEVYIQAIREVVDYGRQAIVLVPEISLTPQTIRRFRRRFESVAVLHSHLSDAERHWHWQRIAAGEVQVVVGARSAVFAPTPHLGLIVIDEEHETTFKQQTTPRYHAREVAQQRARQEKIPLVLGSATPTLESLWKAKQKEYHLCTLAKRVEQRPLPPVVTVDTRNDPKIARGHSLGRAMESSIRVALKDGGQVILFLNIRGFSPVLWCARCAAGVKCPECDITLTWHKDRRKVVCHSCEYEADPPKRCPICEMPGMRFLGAGTQRLEEEVRAKFPDHRVLRMDSDSMKKPGSHDTALDAFRHGQVDILLGTQMIAKGLDFPNVTLVGVIDADTLLHQPDLRASERTFQLIAQVAGRTGRGERAGRVLVQTGCPDEPVIRFASRHDYLGFARHELKHRKDSMTPPFSQLARIVARGESESAVKAGIRGIAEQLREAIAKANLPIRVIGPALAPIARLRGMHRFHLLMSTTDPAAIRALWLAVSPNLELPREVELMIDVDPLDMR